MRRYLAIVLVTMLAGSAAGTAEAQSPLCQQLVQQLQRIERSGAPVDSLSDALIRQRDALARGMADYRQRCQPTLFGTVSPQCPAIQARLAEMQGNLATLEARTRRAGNASFETTAADRARIIAALRQNGCGPDGSSIVAGPAKPVQNGTAPIVAGPGARGGRYFTLNGPGGPVTYFEDESGRIVRLESPAPPTRVAVAPPPRQGGLFGTLFGERPPGVVDPDEMSDRPGSGELEGEGGSADGSGGYRTLCVRMCDGYYFPISYSTSRSRFATDSDICRARCPGAETRLFAHPTGTDSETAVSADDSQQPYTKIPNAMRYRTQYVSGCGCGRPDPTLLPVNLSSEEGATSASATVKVGDIRADLPVPQAKPEWDEDPDTLFNAAANFTPVAVEKTAPGEAAAKTDPSAPRSVRVVGPKFFATR
ncbi:DUF2865 domain-containing protein [Prosthecomicrobium sp. N25]|uniref:DUF2865 domain-containing protein n=1 Tax=Prosthecomicrobium sp. N25 TaxID=3129254 RepID=UPI0030780FC4